MESSIRDIFIFWKLSWGLENDKYTPQKTITFAYIYQNLKNDKTLLKIDDLEPNIDRGPHLWSRRCWTMHF